jgi:cytochrome P450
MKDPVTFTDESVQRCPFPVYDRLREEQPVYRDPENGHYVLTRYEDIRNVLLNPDVFSNRAGFLGDRWAPEANKVFEEKGWLPIDTLVSNDPPEHTWFRGLVDKVFTNPKVAALEPRIDEIISELIDAFPDNEEVEFLEAFAVPLPMYMIAEQLGVSPHDRGQFKIWSDAGLESTSPTTPERQVELAHILVEMQRYMAKEFERVRTEPDESLLSSLVHVEKDGRKLSMRELQNMLLQLLLAGNETTTTVLASGMKVLIERPELAEKVHADPNLARTLAEEVLRTATPLQALFRKAKADETISGVAIPAGAIVEVRFGAANRDPRQFECPGDIDLERKNATSQLAFGAGIHVCVGNRLARAELRLAFQALTRRLSHFRYSRGERSVVPMEGYLPYGLRRLWMTFDWR